MNKRRRNSEVQSAAPSPTLHHDQAIINDFSQIRLLPPAATDKLDETLQKQQQKLTLLDESHRTSTNTAVLEKPPVQVKRALTEVMTLRFQSRCRVTKEHGLEFSRSMSSKAIEHRTTAADVEEPF
jgi:hypothetical protein